MFKKRGRRGISPLIATVLLIAFAVAIGVMIMSWATNASDPGDCSKVELSLQTMGGKPSICYDPLKTKLLFIAMNTGDVDIKYLKLSITSKDMSYEELDVPNSAIKVNDVITQSMNYVKSGTFKVELVPMVIVNGKEKACRAQAVGIESIERCN